MASGSKLALQSLQIGSTETPPKLPEKEGHRNPLQVSGSSFRNTLSRDLTDEDKPPLFLPVWFVMVVLFLWGRRLEEVQEMGEAGRREETALPAFEWPFIKEGLLLKTAEEGRRDAKSLSSPKKAQQGLQCLFQALPKNETTDLEKDLSYRIGL